MASRTGGISTAISIAVLAVVLSACNAAHMNKEPETGGASEASFTILSEADIEDRLTKAADRSAEALDKLSRIEQSRTEPAPSPIKESKLPQELGQRATVEWVGPADELLRSVASNIGYSFHAQGAETASPIMVEVSQKKELVARILESVGLQLIPKATLVVDPNAKKLFLRYDAANSRKDVSFGD